MGCGDRPCAACQGCRGGCPGARGGGGFDGLGASGAFASPATRLHRVTPRQLLARYPKTAALFNAALADPGRYPGLAEWLGRRHVPETGFGWAPVVMAVIAGVSAIAGIAQGEQAKKQQKDAQNKALKLQEKRNAEEIAIQKQVADSLVSQNVPISTAQTVAATVSADVKVAAQRNLIILGAFGLGAILMVQQ